MENLKKIIIVCLIVLVGLFLLKVSRRGGSDLDAKNPNVLSAFEKDNIWGISPEKGFDIKLSNKHVTQGKHSLEVKFSKGDLPSINTKRLKQDWGKYEAVSVDIFNPQKEEIDLNIRIDDTNGKRFNITRELAPGANTIRLEPDQLATKINPSNIKFVVFYLSEPNKRYTLFFDNLILQPKELLEEVVGAKPDFSGSNQAAASVTSGENQGHGNLTELRKAVEFKPGALPASGEIKIALAKLKKMEEGDPLISSGIPFGLGQLKSIHDFIIVDTAGNEIPIAAKVLANWPQDGSIRSVLVQFKHPIPELFEYVTLKWGVKRQAKDLKVIEPNWRFSDGIIVMPAQWMCDSQVSGELLPMGHQEYDKQASEYFVLVSSLPKTGNIRNDKYYSSPYVYYQLYARSGEMKFFIEGRQELLDYRENDLILDGENRGRAKVGGEPRYVFMDAMLNDYLLTGDPRTLEVAGYMASYLKNHVPPSKAYFPKGSTGFWTERLIAFPFLGVFKYYEMTGDKEYLKASEEYMKNVHRTQLNYPDRGGFIHNLYAHDPEEGAGKDEYGGSPFMTGLLLEAIIEYHRFTGSEIAADSIFRAVDWLMNEGLAPGGETFKYMTSAQYINTEGEPDLNMLILHAFGYAYRLSGYQNDTYLSKGQILFDRGVKDAFLRMRKQFNQNYRSSGHFLAYVEPGLQKKLEQFQQYKSEVQAQPELIPTIAPLVLSDVLYYEPFEYSHGRFQADGTTEAAVDNKNVYLNGNSLLVKAKGANSNLSIGVNLDDWFVEQYPTVNFSYRIDPGVPVGMAAQTEFGDWICLGGTAAAQCHDNPAKAKVSLIDDGQWHEFSDSVVGSVHSVLAATKKINALRFFTDHNAQPGQQFWIDDFKIKK